MVTLTHQKARHLLQAAAEQALAPNERLALEAHIAACNECRDYATNLVNLQNDLRRVMRQHWDARQPALSVQRIKERSGRAAVWAGRLDTFGRLAILPVLVFALLMAYKVTGTPSIFPAASALTIPAPTLDLQTPTPPAQNTATQSVAPRCDRITYLVQEGDTLEGIAARLGVSKEVILSENGLGSESLMGHSELSILVCPSTSTPTTTTTITP